MTVTMAVPSLAPDPAPARLVIRLQGYSDDPRVSPDHHLRVVLNDTLLGEERFEGMGVHELSLPIPPTVLTAGDNRLALQMVGDTGAVVDLVNLNRVRIELRAGFRASDDRLAFAAPAGDHTEYLLTGFATPAVTVLDIANPDEPVRLSDVLVEADDGGGYRARFGDMAPYGTRYLAFTEPAARPPARITANRPSNLRDGGEGADYIVITHADFAAALGPLVQHRAQQGLRTALVDIEDVYDEFSAGVFDPRAVRDFLRHASVHWPQPAPTYVLLVGESNFDYRRGYGSGPPNYVPSIMVDTQSGHGELTAYASDAWFVTLGEDDRVPDILVGRFSVSTAEQAAVAVDKTLRYEAQPLDAPWRRRLVLVADDTDAKSMEPFSEHLAGLAPPDTVTRRFYAAHYPITRSLNADIRGAIDEGVLAMSFAGHGNVALWSPWPGGGYIFDNSGIAQLRNGDAMPLFTAATCMNGWINHPLKPVSMGELWLTHAAGGGAASWTPSGFASLGAQWTLLGHVYRGLYDGGGQSLGALVAEASFLALGESAGNADVVGQFLLVGDPALMVSGVPPLPTPTPAPAPPPTPTACPRTASTVPAVRRARPAVAAAAKWALRQPAAPAPWTLLPPRWPPPPTCGASPPALVGCRSWAAACARRCATATWSACAPALFGGATSRWPGCRATAWWHTASWATTGHGFSCGAMTRQPVMPPSMPPTCWAESWPSRASVVVG